MLRSTVLSHSYTIPSQEQPISRATCPVTPRAQGRCLRQEGFLVQAGQRHCDGEQHRPEGLRHGPAWPSCLPLDGLLRQPRLSETINDGYALRHQTVTCTQKGMVVHPLSKFWISYGPSLL